MFSFYYCKSKILASAHFASSTMINMKFLIIFVLIGSSQCSVIATHSKSIECELYDLKNCTQYNQCTPAIETCAFDSERPPSCFVLWYSDPETAETKVHMKGCFTDSHECNQTECVSKVEPKKNLNYCCCKGSLCNADHKYVPTTTEATTQVPKEKTSEENTLYVLIACLILSVLAAVVGIGLFLYKRRKQAMFNELPTIEPEVTSSSPFPAIRDIELITEKAHGRFGAVWEGRLKNEEVAVKIFPMQERESFMSEQEIYKLPRMEHPNILHFLGAGEKTIKPGFWLVTSYHSHGSLCDYLKAHTVNWPTLCRIAESMSRGLMHLHEEIGATKTELLKPAVAHRDFKSKNVLLKSDLTACIADFGLAMVFQPGMSCGDTHGQVGTRRYMAPEVLEGAINFNRDAFLRIDVYACGLVLWEMVSRCYIDPTPSFAPPPPGEYTLPFETELGHNPTLDQMQESVVMNKMRPQILNHWREHPGLNAICDTMEECWDHDAEARLSSSCVMERISQHSRYTTTPLLIETNNENLLHDVIMIPNNL